MNTAESEADTLELPPVPEFGSGRPRWAAQRIHPRRLARGHLTQWARLKAWTIATGHPTRARTVAARAAGLGFAALVVWRTANQEPRLLTVAAGAYAISAWRAGRPVPPSEDDLKRRVVEGVAHLIGDQPAIFLADVYTAFQNRPAAQHLDDARLRAVLVHCGVTIHRSVRVSPTQTGRSGIKRTDIEALLSPGPVDTPLQDVDAGQPDREGAVELPEGAVEQPVDRV
ncbi:hypothetical protein ACFV2V_13800 [Streptomyces sp. NPDC059698]|uniref:hypothetical protein n=1 Tax=unclassified Streptomyces TaxID=2593676 RepID=UPI00093F39C6|nr:hypothetical protein [Streptomyces sp. CB02366]OKJ38258.1 hypothetical protein AMK24_11440 [Streptomyces sp. CB02366]